MLIADVHVGLHCYCFHCAASHLYQLSLLLLHLIYLLAHTTPKRISTTSSTYRKPMILLIKPTEPVKSKDFLTFWRVEFRCQMGFVGIFQSFHLLLVVVNGIIWWQNNRTHLGAGAVTVIEVVGDGPVLLLLNSFDVTPPYIKWRLGLCVGTHMADKREETPVERDGVHKLAARTIRGSWSQSSQMMGRRLAV